MTSFYKRLYQYRQRDNRSPLEDFLSEALADLLDRAPIEVVKDFVMEVLVPDAARHAWRALSDQIQKFEVLTQQWTDDRAGRMDLVLTANGRPFFVIESKVYAEVRRYGERGDDDETEFNDQLARYCSWLHDQKKLEGWKGGVALLSHFADPPSGFLDGAGEYCDLWHSTPTWAHVFRWLQAARDEHSDAHGHTWCDLAKDLMNFLREQNMSAEHVTSLDLAAAQVYVGSSERFNNTFGKIYLAIKEEVKDIRSGQKEPWDFHTDANLVWDWVYLNADNLPKNTYISWGIRWPENSKFWTEPKGALPQAVHAFVNLGTEDKKPLPLDRLPQGKIPKGWSCVRSPNEGDALELVAGRSLSEFPIEADKFTEELSSWIKGRIKEIKAVLPTIK